MPQLSYRLSLAALVALSACSFAGTPMDTDTASESTSEGSTTGKTSETTTVATSTTDQPTTTIGETTTSDPTSTTTGNSNTSESSTTDIPGTSGESSTGETSGSTGPVPPACDDGEKNGDETDTDCGGSCSPCADGLACVEPKDCQSMSCVDNTCGVPPPSCEDGQQNADETDVDCGGSCMACADNLMCLLPEDCQSKNCKEGTCAPAACDDTILNGSETDVDCGGFDCPACQEGDLCNADGDCLSNSCVDKVCVAPSCEDMKLNQDETDVDCGGPNCPKCEDGLACMIPADCQSGVCDDMLLCAAPSCTDNVKNGMETDVDCGGGGCKPCSIPGLVINEVDYDQPLTDGAEFIEILNNTAAPINLAGHAVVLVNGANPPSVYTTINLAPAGTLNPGQYLVIAPANFMVPANVLKVNFTGATNQIQNGAPDGIALINTMTMKLVDALSYEGSVAALNIPGVGMSNLVEGMALPGNLQDSDTEAASFSRLPNGYDGNNAATDWALSKVPTPGAANLP